MKRFQLGVCCCLLFQFAMSQNMDVKELTSLADLTQTKLETHLQKKGYKRNFLEDDRESGVFFTREEKNKRKNSIHCFAILGKEKGYELAYHTTSLTEDSMLKQELLSMGFTGAPKTVNGPILYQKQNITVESFTKKIDTAVFYVLKIAKKELPRKKDIAGAEDLLQLDAHEYLIDVFGKENVKTDVFYFTETETNKCSVLFPNTNREAIFIWNDETNLKDLSFIVIGGSLKSRGYTGNVNQVAHNIWASKQGIYCGMSLKEVEQINQAPIRFYNWHTESAGYLAPNNKGLIDFNKLGIVFNCLNCSFLKVANSQVTDSDSALEENQKVYVTTLIILPDKKSNDASARR